MFAIFFEDISQVYALVLFRVYIVIFSIDATSHAFSCGVHMTDLVSYVIS
jgi:hypothetical protein